MNNVVKATLGELNLTDRFLFAETMDEPEAYLYDSGSAF